MVWFTVDSSLSTWSRRVARLALQPLTAQAKNSNFDLYDEVYDDIHNLVLMVQGQDGLLTHLIRSHFTRMAW